MFAVAVVLLIGLLLLLFRTCGPRTCGPGNGGPQMHRQGIPDKGVDTVSVRAKKQGRPETIPIDEDRNISTESPKYEGPVDLGTKVEMLTK